MHNEVNRLSRKLPLQSEVKYLILPIFNPAAIYCLVESHQLFMSEIVGFIYTFS
jgi:hypothetical protein